jgi:hypothetical protein
VGPPSPRRLPENRPAPLPPDRDGGKVIFREDPRAKIRSRVPQRRRIWSPVASQGAILPRKGILKGGLSTYCGGGGHLIRGGLLIGSFWRGRCL